MRNSILLLMLGISLHTSLAQELGFKEFAYKPLPYKKATAQALQEDYWWRVRSKKEPIQRIHTQGSAQIHTVKVGGSTFRFFQTPRKKFLLSGEVNNRRIRLRGGLQIGMKREAFFSRFPSLQDNGQSQLTQRGPDGFYSYTFRFRWGRLTQIAFEFYPD